MAFGCFTMLPIRRADAQASPAAPPAAEVEARSLFEAGEVAFAAGRYARALSYFERAHTLSNRPALLFNIGLCHDRLRDDDAAIEAYERYLAAAPQVRNRAEVDGRLEALRAARMRRASRERDEEPPRSRRGERSRRGRDAARANGTAENRSSRPAVTLTPARWADSSLPPPAAAPAFYETWWFWTVVGAVVVGGAVGIGVAASGDPDYATSDVGGVVFTLGGDR